MGYKRSVFPEGGIDTLQEIFDLPPSQLSNAERFQYLKTKSNKTQTEIDELNSLTITLQNYIIDSERWNKFCDICINLEIFFQDNVQDYIDTKQTEFNTYITSKTNELNSTITTKTNEFNAKLSTFSYQGQYDSTATYKQWSVITYNYETYISKQNNNLNHTPSGDVNDLWWFKSSARGSQGIPGVGLTFVGAYNNATAYSTGMAVNYNNSIYYCTLATTGNLPTNTTYWAKFIDGISSVIQNTEPSSKVLGMTWIQTF